MGAPKGVPHETRSAESCGELTDRQQDILELLSEGYTLQEIGAKLLVTRETVKSHVRIIYRALGARNAANAVAIAIFRGYLEG